MNDQPIIDQPSIDNSLPLLHQGILDEATVHAWIDDLSLLTQIQEVQVKSAGNSYGESSPLPIGIAGRRLLQGELRAVQVRYQWQGQEWLDTLMKVDTGFRMVRMELNSQAAPASL